MRQTEKARETDQRCREEGRAATQRREMTRETEERTETRKWQKNREERSTETQSKR